MLKKYSIKNLDCIQCAGKIENRLKQHTGVRSVSLNFATLTLSIDTDDIEKIKREIKKMEPEVDIIPLDAGLDLPMGAVMQPFNVKREVIYLVAASLLFLIHLFFERQLHLVWGGLGEYCIAVPAYLLAGWNVLRGAFKTLRKGDLFDENVLMTIATAGAFAIHALSEAVGVMIFFKIGELLQNAALSRSRRSIRRLLEIRPDFAHLVTKKGVKKVSLDIPQPGDTIIVKPGEKIPLDGVVVEGASLVNTAPLTGEPVPVTVKNGSSVLAGEINMNSLLTITVSKPFLESSIVKILDLVENATAKKAKTERFITVFARYYTPAVVFISLCIALVPPLLFAGQHFGTWIYRALVLLVISCPCALIVSIPLGYFGGIGGASRRGILVKGSNFIDVLAEVGTVIFDKTGTLSQGIFKVKEVVTRNGYSRDELLSYAALAETHSNHPIAKSILEAARGQDAVPQGTIREHHEISGYGVKANIDGHWVIVGSDALLHRENVAHDLCSVPETVVFVAIQGTFAGYLTLGDELKYDSHDAVSNLRKEGIHTIAMLTGDNDAAARLVSETLKLDAYRAQLLPEDKVHEFEKMISGVSGRGKVAFVGDGINDAPVLARADVGIAMGALGSDAAIETADVVLMTDHPSKVADAIAISKKTKAIVWQNIVAALTIKALFISLGSFGLAGMWEAVFADMGTTLLAILNSARTFRTGGVR